MKYNTAKFPQARKVKLQLLSDEWNTDEKADQSIINTPEPANAINDEIFTVMSRTPQEQGHWQF